MEISWGLALWEARIGLWWRCSLSCSWWPKTEGVMQRSWGLAPWREPMRGYWWSLVAAEDTWKPIGNASTMWWPPRSATAVEWSQPELRVLQKAELEKWPLEEPRRSRVEPAQEKESCYSQQNWKTLNIRHGDAEFGTFPAGFWSCFGPVFLQYDVLEW